MLVVENLRYTYDGKKDVLKGINASFEVGNLYCIEGKSGSGKTTFLSLASGLDKIIDGDIKIDGKSLKSMDLDTYRSKDIGVIFQSYNLLMQMSAIDNILLSMYISNVKVKEQMQHAYSLLELVGISKQEAERKVIELSGGQQQRVAIARAISHSPKYIFADEPTGNLDSETEQKIMEIFEYLIQQGKCIVIVTHSNRVVKYADFIYKMKNGELSVDKSKK